MTLTNYQIFEYNQDMVHLFEKDEPYIPVKANFIIQKNIKMIATAAQDIEKARVEVASHYGQLSADCNQFIIPPEKIEEANQEIYDLFAIEQDLNIVTIKLEDLGNIQLTPKQMQALMFMIEE